MSFQEYAERLEEKAHLGKVKLVAMVGAVALLFAICAFAVISMFSTGSALEIAKADSDSSSELASDTYEASATTENETAVQICVDVQGCVVAAGVYYLDEGSRVAEAIALAGGFSDGASASSINQARVLVDGEQLYVPSAEEVASGAAASASSASGATGTTGASGSSGVASSTTSSSSTNSGLININTATSEELQTLSGIGESKAAKIIAYRESNGYFSSVDDLLNVSGIGEKTLESLRAYICV